MSLPDPNSKEPNPAAPNPADAPPPAAEFDLLAFWIQYGKLIIRIATFAFLAVGVWGAIQFMEYRKRVGSEEALAGAKTPEEFRKVISDWGNTPSAAIAHLRLADELRKASKPEEAATALKDFLEKFPAHPLRAGAAHALAADLESAGKIDEALTAYQRLSSFGTKSAFAPLALIGQARVLNLQGKPDDARRALESVQQQFPDSPFFEEANTWLEEIKSPAGTKTGGSPRPVPPVPPVPPAPGVKVTPPPGGGTPIPALITEPQIPSPAPSAPAGATPPPVPAPMPPAPPNPPAPTDGGPPPSPAPPKPEAPATPVAPPAPAGETITPPPAPGTPKIPPAPTIPPVPNPESANPPAPTNPPPPPVPPFPTPPNPPAPVPPVPAPAGGPNPVPPTPPADSPQAPPP